VINGSHVILFSSNAEADRAFFADVLGFPHVDAGGGWRIFALPPAEAALHPADGASSHELYFMCDDVEATMEELRAKGVAFTADISEERWGRATSFRLPGGSEVGMYEPHHPRAAGLSFGRDLRGTRFAECDLSNVVMRGVDIAGMDIDAPWLSDGGGLLVNGVDVTPFVEQELDRRFPGRGERRAASPAGLRAAWTAVERAWDAAIERAAALPAGSVDVRIDDEWSFSETLRHLVHATDIWLGKCVLGLAEADFHPLGVRYGNRDPEAQPYDDVLAARADRSTMVRDFVATVTDEVLDEERRNPHDPTKAETVRSCLHVVLEESWEHLRFALRDLDAIESPIA
jgi:catechol 2,3-dioxygenase-like lactoylglutathione lyase family enzyme